MRGSRRAYLKKRKMKKETFEGLCSIVNEMTAIRQKCQESLSKKIKDYELPDFERTHLKLQMKMNIDKISDYARIKVELRRVYERYKDGYV